MQDPDFTDDFCRFLQTTIPSVDSAELLLALASEPDRAWATGELTRKIPHLNEGQAAKSIDELATRQLVVLQADRRAQYRTLDPVLQEHVKRLARLYEQRPVTLIRMIYALRDQKIKSFADAFKLKGT